METTQRTNDLTGAQGDDEYGAFAGAAYVAAHGQPFAVRESAKAWMRSSPFGRTQRCTGRPLAVSQRRTVWSKPAVTRWRSSAVRATRSMRPTCVGESMWKRGTLSLAKTGVSQLQEEQDEGTAEVRKAAWHGFR